MTHSHRKEIIWLPAFETGNADLDVQHIQLLKDSKHIEGLVSSGAPWEQVRDSVAIFENDCRQHFRFEETLLKSTDFPRLDYHIEQHHRIEDELREITAFVAEADGQNPRHGEKLLSLELTLIEVILRHDLDFKSHFLNSAGR